MSGLSRGAFFQVSAAAGAAASVAGAPIPTMLTLAPVAAMERAAPPTT